MHLSVVSLEMRRRAVLGPERGWSLDGRSLGRWSSAVCALAGTQGVQSSTMC